MPGALVNAEAVVGEHCIVNTGASIGHECRIGDFSHIASHATLCGNVSVGEGTWIGAGATVIQGVSIGEHCFVGAGAVVIRDVPAGAVVAGVPAKILKYKPGFDTPPPIRGNEVRFYEACGLPAVCVSGVPAGTAAASFLHENLRVSRGGNLVASASGAPAERSAA